MRKRIFDFIAALLGLIVLAPVLLLLALIIGARLGRPVFFTQLRPGQNGRIFRLIKFRTMTEATDSEGELLSDGQRLTALGRILRSTSLDELPTLINVLKGDMSLVGPRPLLVDYLPLYSRQQCRRHEVRPGVTGWAQLNGRNAVSWERKFELDVWYVDNQTFWLDLKILFQTVFAVLQRKNINQQGNATMTKFTGATKEQLHE